MEASQQHIHSNIPASVPPNVAAIYKAVELYWADKRHFKPPRDSQISKILENRTIFEVACSESTVRRERTSKHADYFPVWPIPRDMPPPWEAQVDPQPVALTEVDQVPVELTGVDADGRPVCIKGYLSRAGTALAAAFGGIAILDAADGKMDGVIHWCHVVVQLAAQHAHL